MEGLFKCRPEGDGKHVNKKQLQDFVKEILFEKTVGDISDMVQKGYDGMPGAAAAVVRALDKAGKSGDFSKIKPLLEFAFDENLGVKKR